jgi:hypothetical protein
MITNNGNNPRMARTLLMFVLAGLGAHSALAGDIAIERPADFGIAGIAASETARISVVLRDDPFFKPGDPVPVCVVELRFSDNMNRTLAVLQKVQLQPNVAVQLELPGTQAYMWQPVKGVRPTIRGQVKALWVQNGCPAIATMEVFDGATGKGVYMWTPAN